MSASSGVTLIWNRPVSIGSDAKSSYFFFYVIRSLGWVRRPTFRHADNVRVLRSH